MRSKSEEQHKCLNEYLSDRGTVKGISKHGTKSRCHKRKKLKFKISGTKIKTAAHQTETHHINTLNMQNYLQR